MGMRVTLLTAIPAAGWAAARRARLGLLGFAALVLVAVAVPGSALSAVTVTEGTSPVGANVGTGKTVIWSVSRSGTAGASGGSCGTRLACFKTAITWANASTSSIVENAGMTMINVAEPDQDVNLALSGKQYLIAPDADPNANGRPDVIDALNRISLGGGTCYTCALQAAERELQVARADSHKVIVLVTERINVFRSTGFTSGGLPTGYPPMELQDMAGHFDANTVVRAFAVGPDVTCSADPNGYGSLNEAAALTPGGTCTRVTSFENLGPILADAVSAAAASTTSAAAPTSASASG